MSYSSVLAIDDVRLTISKVKPIADAVLRNVSCGIYCDSLECVKSYYYKVLDLCSQLLANLKLQF